MTHTISLQHIGEMLEGPKRRIEAAIDRHPHIWKISTLKSLERKTGYSRAWILLTFLTAVITIVLGLGGMVLVARLGGFIYPAYATFKAIDTPGAQGQKFWLSYWIILAAIGLTEPIVGAIVHLGSVYHTLKLVFYVWLFQPNTGGSLILYEHVLQPVVHMIIPQQQPQRHSAGIHIPNSSSRRTSEQLLGPAAAAAAAAAQSHAPEDVAPPEGQRLSVTVGSAAGLPAMEGESTHAYCLLCVRDVAHNSVITTKYKTRTITDRNPRWSEKVVLLVPNSKTDKVLVATVCHRTGLGADSVIGRASIPLSAVASAGGKSEGIYPLEDEGSENPVGVAGSLQLSISLKSDEANGNGVH